MKIKVKGKNPRINLNSSKSIKKELRRLEDRIAQLLSDQTDGIADRMETLIQETLIEQLYSDRFEAFLRSILQEDSEDDSSLREIAEQLLNEDAEVVTNGGAVSGTITEVGEDYVILRETDSTTVIVPFENAISIRPL